MISILQPEPVIVHYLLQLLVEITRSIFNEYLKGKLKYALFTKNRKVSFIKKTNKILIGLKIKNFV